MHLDYPRTLKVVLEKYSVHIKGDDELLGAHLGSHVCLCALSKREGVWGGFLFNLGCRGSTGDGGVNTGG